MFTGKRKWSETVEGRTDESRLVWSRQLLSDAPKKKQKKKTKSACLLQVCRTFSYRCGSLWPGHKFIDTIKSHDTPCSLTAGQLYVKCQNVRMSPVMEINQLVCFCRVGPYILNEGGMLKTGWAPGEQQPVRFTYLEGNQASECFWEMGGKTWVRHGSFPAGWSRAPCHTDTRPGGWWGDGQLMKAFFFFPQYELIGRLHPVRTHTLWWCRVFTGKPSICTPGRWAGSTPGQYSQYCQPGLTVLHTRQDSQGES